MAFEVGDRVEFIDKGWSKTLYGKIGTVQYRDSYIIGVLFDGNKNVTGWYPERLRLIEEPSESILDIAKKAVHGDRGEDYGHPYDDLNRTAKLWSALTGYEFTAKEVGLCMICVKLSRETNKHKEDNLVDIAGYAEVVNTIVQKEQELAS